MTESKEDVTDVPPPRALRWFHNPVTAWVVLAGGFLMTATAWHVSRTAVRERAEERFAFRSQEIADAVHERLIVYEQVLWGGVGLFNAGGFPTREQWRSYVETLDLEEHWAGIQGLGVAVPVAPADLPEFIARQRASGTPDYTVRPEEPRDEYSAIVYLEPLDWRNQRAIGYDMWSNEVRRAAMTKARDSGQAATSGVITLVQETDDNPQLGFLTYLPVYAQNEDGQRGDLIAWVYAAFRMNDLMTGVLGTDEDGIWFDIYDSPTNQPSTLLFASQEAPPETEAGSRLLDRTMSVPLQGRNWTMHFMSSERALVGAEAAQPTLVAVGGIIVDLLLFYVIGSLAFLHRKAARLAKKMTAKVRAASKDLENQNELLARHTETLERTNRELQEFAFVASHDLQEPLRAVGTFSELLEERYGDQIDDDGREWLAYLREGAERMSTLVRDLLGYSRVDREEDVFTTVCLDQSLDTALKNLTVGIAESGVTITRSPLPVVEGNPAQVTQLFQNLVGNAIKYRTPEGETTISITGRRQGADVLVEVRDNGIGVAPEHHRQIFEVFKRVNSRSRYPGNGIGLSTCRRIIERHGGQIGVRSALGAGSTFWFSMRAAAVESVPPAPGGLPDTLTAVAGR